jgi:hypothetical protein
MRVGISGHQRLQQPSTWEWVVRETRNSLVAQPVPLVGITSLAIGADTIFAELVLEMNGVLEVILPFPEYEQKFTTDHDRQTFQRLLASASIVEVLQRQATEELSYYIAGQRVVDTSELVIVVWDGKPAAGLGGTGDIAHYAERCQKPLIHLNPMTRSAEHAH